MDRTLKILCWFVLAVPLVSTNQNAAQQGSQYGQGGHMMMYNPNYMSRFPRPQMPFIPQQQQYSQNEGQFSSNGQYRTNYQPNYPIQEKQEMEDMPSSEGQQDFTRYQPNYSVDQKQYQGYYQPKAGYSKEDYPVSSKDIESENNMQFMQQTNKPMTMLPMSSMAMDPRSMPMNMLPSQDYRKQGREDKEYVVLMPDGTSHRVEYNPKEDKFYPTGQNVLEVGDREKGGAQFLYDPRRIEALSSYSKNEQNQYQNERPQRYQYNNNYYNQQRY